MVKKIYNRYIRLKQRMIEKLALYQFDGRMALMFHEVTDDKGAWYDARYSISTTSLCVLLDEIQRLGYDIVSPYELLVRDKRRKVCLTFDDVFRGVYENVFPIMKERGLPFVIFPAISLIGKEGYINEKMLLEMLEYEGTYLGTHSKTHCVLKEISKEQSVEEIEIPKRILEKKTGREIEIMAYPYGSLSEVGKREIRIVKKCYKFAFSTLQTCVWSYVNPHFIPRMNMNETNYSVVLEYMKKG